MTFTTWLRQQTGLSLYDFRVLDRDGTAEKEVRDLFSQWLEDARPVSTLITEAIIDAAQEDFDVCLFD